MLKFESCFARGIGQRLYFSMMLRARAVEYHFGNAFASRRLGSNSAELLRSGYVGFRRFLFGSRRRRRDRRAFGVVDELDVDILVGKTNAHPRAFRCARNF